eukprot:NODE_475_length_8011_cov_0.074065.p5 type:complete len:242 gc:universal NODE_475_length_8011_cov_0.074065:1261-536(-)
MLQIDSENGNTSSKDSSSNQTSRLNWKEICSKYGKFKQISAGKYNYFFCCSCGIKMVDNKTSVTYHLINVCKDLCDEERSAFMNLLKEYHRINPIPKKKISEWKILSQEFGEFCRNYNKRVYRCKCGVVVSYKKNDVISHLIVCGNLDCDLRNTFKAFIRSSVGSAKSRNSKKRKIEELANKIATETKNIPKLIYPLTDHDRIVAQLESNISSLQGSLSIAESKLELLQDLSDNLNEKYCK